MSKGKVAFYWAGSCGGCEVAVVDIDEMLFDVLENFDIVFWPCAIDTKYSEVEQMEDEEIDVCFFNGCIRNEENLELAKLLRKKSKTLIAFGSCSHLGGIPGLGNLSTREETLDFVYNQCKSTDNEKGTIPATSTDAFGNVLHLPVIEKDVKALDDVVDVDFYIPGCPPPLEVIKTALMALVTGDIATANKVLCPERTVCDECTKERKEKAVRRIRRFYDGDIDPERCLLEQGILCMGPATREGCGAACPSANMPCTGCMGAPPAAIEQGARMISAIASVTDVVDEKVSEEEDIKSALDEIRDPAGLFYMYSMPKSLIRRRQDE